MYSGAGSGGLQGAFCEALLGESHARHRCFQMDPMDPPQGTAESLSQASGTSRKTCLNNAG